MRNPPTPDRGPHVSDVPSVEAGIAASQPRIPTARWWESLQSIAITVPLALINIDEAIQCRAEGIDSSVVEEYAREMENGAKMPPVVVIEDGPIKRLVDGVHRVEAARKNGFRSIMALVYPGDRDHALVYAASANGEHGKRRTNADKRRAVEILLKQSVFQEHSDRSLAELALVDHKTVASVRHELTEARQIPRRESCVGLDGRQQKVRSRQSDLCVRHNTEDFPQCRPDTPETQGVASESTRASAEPKSNTEKPVFETPSIGCAPSSMPAPTKRAVIEAGPITSGQEEDKLWIDAEQTLSSLDPTKGFPPSWNKTRRSQFIRQLILVTDVCSCLHGV